MELKGKTAFVSGGGKNIGRAIVLELAEMGANVVINGASDEAACSETASAAEALPDFTFPSFDFTSAIAFAAIDFKDLPAL